MANAVRSSRPRFTGPGERSAGEIKGTMHHLSMAPRRVSRRRELHREAMRARVLAAASKLVRHEGIKGLGMRALAAEVDLTAPTLYGYFASKDAVLDALFEQATEMLFAAMETAHAARPAGRAPQFGADAIAYRAFAHDHPEFYQLLFGRVDSTYKPGEAAREFVNGRMRALSERLVPEIMAAGVAPELAPECFQALVVTAQGYISVELNDSLCDNDTLEPRRGSEEEYLRLLDMMLAGYITASERVLATGELDRRPRVFGSAAASG